MATDDVVAQGDASGRLLAVLRPRLHERQERILKRLLQEHTDGALTETSMRSGIAAIAELRALERDLAADFDRGHSALLREIDRQTARPR